MTAAIVPLWPYFFSLHVALVISLACTLVALLAVGVEEGQGHSAFAPAAGAAGDVRRFRQRGCGYAIGHLVTALSS